MTIRQADELTARLRATIDELRTASAASAPQPLSRVR
jgi:hypothetical protein